MQLMLLDGGNNSHSSGNLNEHELRLQWLIRKLSSRHVKRLTCTGLKLPEIYVLDSSDNSLGLD